MFSSTTALAGLGALFIAVLLFAGVGNLVTYVILVVANRADPDPTGKRPMAVFLFGGSFLTLWIAYIGAIAIITSLVGLIGTHISSQSGSQHPVGDAAVRGITIGLLLVLIAGGLHLLQKQRGLALAESESDPTSPTKRVARSYVAVVSFVSMLIMVVASVIFLYSLLGLIAPGVYHAGHRLGTFRMLLVEAFVLLLTAMIFRAHQRLAPMQLRLFGHSIHVTTVDVVELIE